VFGMWVDTHIILGHQNTNIVLAEEHKTLNLRKICRCTSVRFRTMVPT